MPVYTTPDWCVIYYWPDVRASFWGSYTLNLMQGIDVFMEDPDRDAIAPPADCGGKSGFNFLQ